MSGPDPRQLRGDPGATALLVIDMQNDFVRPGAPLATPRAMEIIPAIERLAAACRARGLPVVYTREMHRREGDDFGIEACFEPFHCPQDGPGSEIVSELRPAHGDVVIGAKRRYDGFHATDLDIVLRGRRIENLLVTGVCTDICVMATVVAARNRDYRCFVVRDAVDGTSAERHEAALLCLSHVFAYVGHQEEIEALFALDCTVHAASATSPSSG